MAIAMRKTGMAEGDYVVLRVRDTPEERADAEQTLRAQGCLRFRHEPLEDGRLRSHGYMRADT